MMERLPPHVPHSPPDDAFDWGDIRFWLVLGLAVIFLLLGLLFVFAPEAGAILFGLHAGSTEALAYVAALGIRDLALGGFILVLAFHSRRAVALLLAVAAFIPLGDVILVASVEGASSLLNLVVHAVAGGVCATLSVLLFRRKPQL